MNNRYDYIELFEIYHKLFTKRQQQIFHSYYLDDLTLSEISTNLLISRSSISKTIKKIKQKLEDYEQKLQLKEKANV